MKDSHDNATTAAGRLIELPVVSDPRGCLSFLQQGGPKGAVPFEIRRVYWIYDIRGDHAHSGRALPRCDEFLVVLSGSCRVHLDNGHGCKADYRLHRPDKALLIPAGTWREISELATNTVILVLASTPYEPHNIIRDYQIFQQSVKQ